MPATLIIKDEKRQPLKRLPCIVFCAQDWIRTSTPFPALPPQGSASTNFATWATEKFQQFKEKDFQ